MIRLVLLTALLSQTLATPTDCQSYVDMVFAFDTSESIKVYTAGETTAYVWQQVLDLARGVVINLPVGLSVNQTQVAAVRFANTTSVMFYLDRYQTSLEAEFGVNSIAVDMGNTNVNTMLKALSGDVLTVSRGMRAGSRKVAVLFTDGFSTYDADQVNASAQALKAATTEVFVVTVGSDYIQQNIEMIASAPLSKYFINVPTYDLLYTALTRLLAGVCNSTVNDTEVITVKPVIQCMPNCAVCETNTTCDVCQVGWYWDETTSSCQVCNIIMDLCFLVDDSGSIQDQGKGNYALLKGFVKNVVTRLDVGLNKTRMALVRFSTNAYIDFYLDTYGTSTDVLQAIQNMDYEGGHTRTDLALDQMRTQVFGESSGNRPDVRDVTIVITDGNSDQPNFTLSNATQAKQDNITLFVVGITNQLRVSELMAIASAPTNERYFSSVDEAHLNLLLTDLTMYVCNPANSQSPAAAANARKKRESADHLSAGHGSQVDSP